MSDIVQRWCGRKIERPDGSEAAIPTLYARLEVGVESALAKDAKDVVTPGADVMLVCDLRTEPFAERVARALRDQGFGIHTYVAPDEADGSPPAPEEAGAQLVAAAFREKQIALAVSVGSGTINDRTKYAAHLAGIPYLCYATAASMNGYNSPIVAIYVKGLKSSVPATPPIGLYADPEVVASAPRLMHLAGLGDLCSKPFAGADAVIAATLTDQTPWRLPTEMVEEVFGEALTNGEAIGRDDSAAIAQLMEALWVSGFSMTLAGTSAPASGGEHLWSHRIDMAQHDAGKPLKALHGTQVGIACALVQPLFGQLATMDEADALARLQGALPATPPDPADEATFAAWLKERHADLSDKSLAAMLPEAARKYDRGYRAQVREGLRRTWPAIQRELQTAHKHAQQVSLALQRAGAPQKPQEMGIAQEESDRILRICRDIRNRFTILDLTAEVLGDVLLLDPV